MKNFDLLLSLIPFNRHNHYRTYFQDNDVLILVKSSYSDSSIYRIKELVSINFLALEYKYSCVLLENGNIQIKKEEN